MSIQSCSPGVFAEFVHITKQSKVAIGRPEKVLSTQYRNSCKRTLVPFHYIQATQILSTMIHSPYDLVIRTLDMLLTVGAIDQIRNLGIDFSG